MKGGKKVMIKKKKEKALRASIAVKEEACACGCHGKIGASLVLLVGVLVLLNAYYPILDWRIANIVIGALIILCGLKGLIMPCNCR